jgi:ATP-dependent DNA helicase RecQ
MKSPYLLAIESAFTSGCTIAILDGFPQAELAEVLDEFEGVVDENSLFDQCVGKGFDLKFAKRLYASLLTPGNHVMTLAQFMRMREVYDEKLISDEACIIQESLRVYFPLKTGEFLEQRKDGNLEERSDDMPEHHIEHIRSGSNEYFIQGYTSDLKTIQVFEDEKDLEKSRMEECIEVDVSADTTELELALCDLIESAPTAQEFIQVVTSPKHDLGDNLMARLRKLQASSHNVGVFLEPKHKDLEAVDISSRATNMLRKFWGAGAAFRNLLVYADPDISRETISISQGQVVDAIIQEIDRGNNGKMPRDIFLTAPTGAGKSLLFQLPAFYASKNGDITIVISPLIALMKDQVIAVQQDRRFEKVAYINSELTYLDRKQILKQTHEGEIDVLYLSPELLLSYDISHFIGERNLGLVVIDEAHLITTWGRDFRVDYWFLGNHLRKIKKYNDLKFPVVAVTATAVYGGTNDMVFDTLSSLEMNNPHMFVGAVRRDDIKFAIRNTQPETKGKKYENWKLKQTVEFIQNLQRNTALKALVYAPYTKHVKNIHEAAELQQVGSTAMYHGSLDSDEKTQSFERFLSGDVRTMVCTKAFGMGIDISDIQVVYHHAPSGHLPDYIQEVGRAARKPEIQGWAALDYSEQDKVFMRTLFGMSSLKSFELQGVLKKLYGTYKLKKSRNMLLSVEDFGHLFENGDPRNLSQKVLTALMMIEKDYLQKYRFNVVVARPKALFVKVFARIPDGSWSEVRRRYGRCITEIPYPLLNQKGFRIVSLDLEKLWRFNFPSEDFPTLKYKFYKGKLFDNSLEVVPELKLDVTIDHELSYITAQFDLVVRALQESFSELQGQFFSALELEERLRQRLDRPTATKVTRFILSLYSSILDGLTGKLADSGSFLAGRGGGSERKYRFVSGNFKAEFSELRKQLSNLFKSDMQVTRFRTMNDSGAQTLFRLGQWLDVLKLGSIAASGGEHPMIFIRVNDPTKLERDIRNDFYKNALLEKTRKKHDVSNQIFDHFFQKNLSDTERWDFIEDFFLGTNIDDLLEKYPGSGELNDVDLIKTISTLEAVERVKVKRTSSRQTRVQSEPGWYGLDDTVTLDWRGKLTSKRVSQWITDDPLDFHKAATLSKIKFRGEANKILFSKLRKFPDYFNSFMGSSRIIEIPKVKGKKKGKILMNDHPREFYAWWRDNREEMVLSMKEKIELFDRLRSARVALDQKDQNWLNRLQNR